MTSLIIHQLLAFPQTESNRGSLKPKIAGEKHPTEISHKQEGVVRGLAQKG
jgi:hypothetical protein